ncbi:TonB-dependent receptor plug domain-containing protein [Cyclobacteriaceae bacterium]|nr:TonB-dependent receptor plug domain-containing protein [Cyclobacteriaceae bacterium]MDA8889755.1 TonB-dependent receptor plug domain-containing protein [Cyclobacteriaceae bacterium]
MIKIVNKFFLCLLLVFGLFQQQQSSAQVIFDDLKIGIDKVESDEVVFNSLQEIGVYYKNNQFEKGLEIASNLFQGQFNQSAIQSKESILNFAIKLSFALDLRDSTRSFMEIYYKINPSFSDRTIPDITPALQVFINNFIKSKNQVSVFVNKFAQSIDFISSTISIYDQDDFERLGVRDLLDLVRITPGFAEIGDFNERQFGTRGVSNTSVQDVLILINGHRISDNMTSTNGPDWISLDYVKQIELVRGPGSAIYGGNAFSGAINIVTKSGAEGKINDINVRLGNGNDFNSINQPLDNAYKINYQYGNQINNTESIYLSATYHQSGGSKIDFGDADWKIMLPESKNLVYMNDTTVWERPADSTGLEYINAYGPSYNFLLNYINNSVKVTANAQANNYYLPRPISQNLWQNHDTDSLNSLRRRIDRREFITIQANLLEKADFENSALELKVAGDHFYKDLSIPKWSAGNFDNSPLSGDEYRLTANLEFSTQALTLGVNNLPNFLLVGAEWYVNRWAYQYLNNSYLGKLDSMSYSSSLVDDATYSLDSSSSLGDRNENFAAFYIQDEMHLIKDKLVLNASVRFNYDEVYSNFQNGLRWGEQYSPRISLVYIAKRNESKSSMVKLRAIYNSAFLPPAFLYRKAFAPPFRAEFGDGLKAQIIESLETGTFIRVNEHWDLNFQTYVNYVRDEIKKVGDFYINKSSSTRISGHEAEFKYRYKSSRSYLDGYNFHVFGNYSFSQTKTAKDSLTSFSNIFEIDSWIDGDTRFPRHYLKFGADLQFKMSELNKARDQFSLLKDYVTKFRITVGINGQLISQSYRKSNYIIFNEGSLPEETAGNEWIELPTLFLLNGNINADVGKYKFGINVYNFLNKEGFISSSVDRLGLQRQEGRMIYFSMGYSF